MQSARIWSNPKAESRATGKADPETIPKAPTVTPQGKKREGQVSSAISGTTDGRKNQYCLALRRQVGVKPRGASRKGPNRLLATHYAESLATSHLAQPAEPPYADPHVRWCGRGGRATVPPIPMCAEHA